MDEFTPSHAPAPTADELGRLRARMADAIAGCAASLTAVAALAVEARLTAAVRRERCDRIGGGIDTLTELKRAFHEAHREAGGGWPADAPSGLTFGVVATSLHNAYFVGYRLWHSLCESGQRHGPATASLVAGLLRAVEVLEDAEEYLRDGGGWLPAHPGAAAATARALRWSAEGLSRVQHLGLGEIDAVILPGPRGPTRVPVTLLACRVVRGDYPTHCPCADPALPSTLLPDVARRVRELVGLTAGLTIHWTGHEAGMRGGCPCHPDAPTAAPADKGQWPNVVHADAGGDLGEDDNPPIALPGPASDVAAGVPAVTTSPTQQQDGPSGGQWLQLNGTRYVIGPGKNFAMIAYMWCRDSATFDELMGAHGAVWEEVVTDAALRTAVSRANAALPRQAGWRIEVDSAGRNLTKKPLGV